MKIWLIHLLITICSLLLNACSSYSSNFDCKGTKGIGCKPLSHVNNMVNNGELGETRQKIEIVQDNSIRKSEIDKVSTIYDERRSNEKLGKVWFNSYVDANDNYHLEKYIYIVLEPSKWGN